MNIRDNERRFREVYEQKLREAMARNPADYFYGPEAVPGVVDKMVRGYATGGANIGPVMKATARALGIKPTLSAVKAFLTTSSEKAS